jgi:hypothetical protein
VAIFYRLLQAIVIGAGAVLLWFFIVGIGDGTVTAANLLLWLAILAVPVISLFVARQVCASGRRGIACVLLSVPAFPAIAYGLILLMMVVLQPDFR